MHIRLKSGDLSACQLIWLRLGLVNWKWATDGFNDSIDLAIASLISVIYFGSSGWYIKTGDRPAAGILGLVGLLQVAGVRTAM